jgi:hypothetical protein
MPMPSLIQAASLLFLLLSGGAAVQHNAVVQLPAPVDYSQSFGINICPIKSCVSEYNFNHVKTPDLLNRCASYNEYLKNLSNEIDAMRAKQKQLGKTIEALEFKKDTVKAMGHIGLVPCKDQPVSK